MFSRRALHNTYKSKVHLTTVRSRATEVCVSVDVHHYIRSRDNSKVATEVCLVDVHYDT